MTPSMSEKTSNSTLEERQARSLALEKAYVHDVYNQIAPHLVDSRYRAWPHVKKFLQDLEPGSIVADIGCGNGKYFDINRETFQLGVDRCNPLLQTARKTGYEALACDNQQLPFRDETFDAAISIAVIHHFGTSERRVRALQELARILRIGGKVMITVWAKEQSHRKFDSQDVLVPWHEPTSSTSKDRGSSAERELTSTTTSEDDLLVYTSHFPECYRGQDFHQNNRQNAIDSRYKGERGCHPSSPSSSELSSPSETCYSFVRRAFKKLAVSTSPYSRHNSSKPYFYSSCRRPWFSESMESNDLLTSPIQQESHGEECLDFKEPDDACIELHHLEETNVIKPSGDEKEELISNKKGEKTWSLNDLLSIIPTVFRIKRPSDKGTRKDFQKRISTISDPQEYLAKDVTNNTVVRSRSMMSCVTRPENVKSLHDTGKNITQENQNAREKLPCFKESVINEGLCTTKPTISDITNCNDIHHSKLNNGVEDLDGKQNPKGLISNCSSEFKEGKDVSLSYPNNVSICNDMVNGMYTREKLHRNKSFFPNPDFLDLQSRNRNTYCQKTPMSIKDIKVKPNPGSLDLQSRNRNTCCQKTPISIKDIKVKPNPGSLDLQSRDTNTCCQKTPISIKDIKVKPNPVSLDLQSRNRNTRCQKTPMSIKDIKVKPNPGSLDLQSRDTNTCCQKTPMSITDIKVKPNPDFLDLQSKDRNTRCQKTPMSIKDIKVKPNPGSLELQSRDRNTCCQKIANDIRNQNMIYSETQTFKDKEATVKSRLSSYYSMPELRTLSHNELFWIIDSHSANTDHSVCAKKDCYSGVIDYLGYLDSDTECEEEEDKLTSINLTSNKDGCPSMLKNGLVTRSLSTNTARNLTSSIEPSGSSTSQVQDLSVGCLQINCLPVPRISGHCKRAKSGTNVESEEPIMSTTARKGNGIQGRSSMKSEESSVPTTTTKNNGVQSESSVESEESIISVIQHSTSEVEALTMKRNQSQSGGHSTQASPLTLLSGSGKSSYSSPPSSASGLDPSKFVSDSNSSQINITKSASEFNPCSSVKLEMTPQEKQALNQLSSNAQVSEDNEEVHNISPKFITDKFSVSNRHFKQMFTLNGNDTPYFDTVKNSVNKVSDAVGECFIQSMDVTFTYQTRENLMSQKKNSLQSRPQYASRSLLPETLKTEDSNLRVSPHQFVHSLPGNFNDQTDDKQQNTDTRGFKGMAEEVISSHEPTTFKDKLQGRHQMKSNGQNTTECSVTDVAECRNNICDITNSSCPLVQYNDCDVKCLVKLFEKRSFENDKILLNYLAILKRAGHKFGEQDSRNSLEAPTQFNSRTTTMQLSDKHKFIDSLTGTRKQNKSNNHFCLFAEGALNNISWSNGAEQRETIEKPNKHVKTRYKELLLQYGRTFQQNHEQDELVEKSIVEGILKLAEMEKLSKVPNYVISESIMFRESDWPVKLSNVNIEYNKVGLMKELGKARDVTHATTQENPHTWLMKSPQNSRVLEDTHHLGSANQSLETTDNICYNLGLADKVNESLKSSEKIYEHKDSEVMFSLEESVKTLGIVEKSAASIKISDTAPILCVKGDKETGGNSILDNILTQKRKILKDEQHCFSNKNKIWTFDDDSKWIKTQCKIEGAFQRCNCDGLEKTTIPEVTANTAENQNRERAENNTAEDQNTERADTSTVEDQNMERAETSTAEDQNTERAETSTAEDQNTERAETSTAKGQNRERAETSTAKDQNRERAETSTAKDQKMNRGITAKFKILETTTTENQNMNTIKGQRIERMIANDDKKQNKVVTVKDSILSVQNEIDNNQMGSSADEVNNTRNQYAQSNRSETSSCFQRHNTAPISMKPCGSDKTELCNHTSSISKRQAESSAFITKREKLGTLSQNTSLSKSTSQESLQDNDEKDGAISYHRYYHVFCRGELDSLIESYVENLHIISSYYDHANWCVVAEKVQVWTI